MPTEDKTPSRGIVLSGLAAGGSASRTAISLVDDAGNTLHEALINEDGSCELPEDMLASAQEVFLGPIDVSVRADRFRDLLQTGDVIDVAALFAGPGPEAPASALNEGMFGSGGRRPVWGHPRH